MIAISTEPKQTPEEVQLAQVHSLQQEISVAISAISGNSLGALEESLWRQEVLCTSLKRLLQTLGRGTDSTTMIRMRSAMSDLHSLNKTYAVLVEQSRNANDLLYALSRGYKTEFPHDVVNSTGFSCSLEA